MEGRKNRNAMDLNTVILRLFKVMNLGDTKAETNYPQLTHGWKLSLMVENTSNLRRGKCGLWPQFRKSIVLDVVNKTDTCILDANQASTTPKASSNFANVRHK